MVNLILISQFIQLTMKKEDYDHEKTMEPPRSTNAAARIYVILCILLRTLDYLWIFTAAYLGAYRDYFHSSFLLVDTQSDNSVHKGKQKA